MSDALLNPQNEDAVGLAMLRAVAHRKVNITAALTEQILEREQYLLKIGALKELDALEANLQREYNRVYKV